MPENLPGNLWMGANYLEGCDTHAINLYRSVATINEIEGICLCLSYWSEKAINKTFVYLPSLDKNWRG